MMLFAFLSVELLFYFFSLGDATVSLKVSFTDTLAEKLNCTVAPLFFF